MKALVFLAPGFEEVEAVTPVDFMRRAGIDVLVAGVGGTEIRGSRGVVIKTDTVASEVGGDFDVVVLPGGMPGAENLAASSDVTRAVTGQAERGKLVAAICAAPAVVLSPMGVLNGRRATCYPGFEDRFSDATFVEERVVVDDNVITSRGPGTAAEFSLAIIRHLLGPEASDAVHAATLQK